MSLVNYFEINSPEELEKAIKTSSNRTVLRFYRPSCPSCQRISSLWMMKQTDPSLKNVNFVSINLENNRDLGIAFRIEYVPTFMSVIGGVMRSKIVGADPAKLERLIQTGYA